jgi:site-specific recombinase XerD
LRCPLEPAPGEPDWVAAIEGLRGAYADSTLNWCRRLFEYFLKWCRENGHTAFPAPPKVVAGWVDHRFAQGLRAHPVMGEVYAIRRVMRALGHADPTITREVKLAIRRGKRTYGIRRRQVPPINADLRDRMAAACPDTPAGLRDRAILALGYDTMCRRGELAALRIEDLTPQADGTAQILVRQEKQDPSRAGSVAYLSARAYAVVKAWLAASGHREGPVLRQVRGGRNGLAPQALSERLHILGRRVGLDPEIANQLSVHSLRIGAVQDLTIAGHSLLQIMRAGRWRHVNSVIDYARATPVNVWAVDDGDAFAAIEGHLSQRRRVLGYPTRAARRLEAEDHAASAQIKGKAPPGR